MADNIVSSLFGMTPEMYQAAQRQQAQQQALQMAKLDPFERATAGLQMADYDLGQGIGGAMGIQDPQLQMIAKRQSLLKGINFNDPASMRDIANKALESGDTVTAAELSKLALEVEAKRANIGKDIAATAASLTDKLSPEQKNAQALADASGAERGSQEWNKTYSTELNRLTNKTPASLLEAQAVADAEKAVNETSPGSPERARAESILKALKIGKVQVTEIGLPNNPEMMQKVMIDPFNPQGKPIPLGAPYSRFTSKQTIDASTKAESAGLTELAQLDARRVAEANKAADAAQQNMGTLQQLLQTPQGISGSGAQIRVGALRVFSTLGLANEKDNEALSNADKFNSFTRSNVLSFIKMLGVNPSNADRDFAASIGPALEKGEKTNQDLIDYLMKKAEWVQKQASGLEEHFYNNKGSLRGYKSPFISGFNETTSKTNPYSGLSDSELAARIAAARAAQK